MVTILTVGRCCKIYIFSPSNGFISNSFISQGEFINPDIKEENLDGTPLMDNILEVGSLNRQDAGRFHHSDRGAHRISTD